MPRRDSLRVAIVDVRRAKRHQYYPGSLYSRRHRRDHASQISARQSYPAFFAPRDSDYIGVAPTQGGTSQQAKSRGTQSLFRVARERNQQSSAKDAVKEERIMLVTNYCSIRKIALIANVLAAIQPLTARSASETERLENLQRAVELLEKQNAELKAEVNSLKSKQAASPADAKFKTKMMYDGKTYVEKAMVEEKPPIYVQQRGPELKLVLGGFVQMNFEDGDVSAFEGRFGQTAVKDRFRLRRARINLTGDFAEQFDFKVEGDFGQGDGLNSNRTAFSATDIFVNWHQYPEAQIKVGQWKAPFGLEQFTPDTTLLFAERSLHTGAITPDRQIGAQLWGKPFASIWPGQKDLLTYYAGIFNGNGRNVSVNDNNNFMYVGRLESTLFKNKFWGESYLKFGGDVLNSRDEQGV